MLAPRSSPGWLAPKSAGGCMSLGAPESLVMWRMVVPQNPNSNCKGPFSYSPDSSPYRPVIRTFLGTLL